MNTGEYPQPQTSGAKNKASRLNDGWLYMLCDATTATHSMKTST